MIIRKIWQPQFGWFVHQPVIGIPSEGVPVAREQSHDGVDVFSSTMLTSDRWQD